jgi:hypothetical protein
LKYQKWSFILKKVNVTWVPLEFDREKFIVKTIGWKIIDIWEESKD